MRGREKVALGALVAFALGVHGHALVAYVAPRRVPALFSVEDRFTRLRAALPPRGRVGWVSDLEPGSALATGEYSTAAYAVVPVVLEDSREPATLVGSFHSSGARERIRAARLVVVTDLGDGLYVLGRRR